MSGILFTDERDYLPKREPKMEAIENLNELQRKKKKKKKKRKVDF